ncbi:MAG: DUF362 domain-containing protein [Desulfosudis oleivorans]|nr:DUF362 domain-containing protein [Desulfosudis oleivorans]
MVDVSADRPIHTDPRLIEAHRPPSRRPRGPGDRPGRGDLHNRDSEWLFRRAGYEALARRRGIRLVDLNYDDLRTGHLRQSPGDPPQGDVPARDASSTADVIVSVPKLKTHKLAGITLSLKNMFGVLPGMVYGWPKNTLHWNGIPLSICEINGTVKTHYSVVDGVVGMEGHGPIMGYGQEGRRAGHGRQRAGRGRHGGPGHGRRPGPTSTTWPWPTGSSWAPSAGEDIAVAVGRLDRARTDFALDPEYAHLRAREGLKIER